MRCLNPYHDLGATCSSLLKNRNARTVKDRSLTFASQVSTSPILCMLTCFEMRIDLLTILQENLD